MYKNKLAVAIKQNNSTFPEDGYTVLIPYNSTYSIFLKNLSDDDMLLSVFVNGQSLSEKNKSFLLKANSEKTISSFLSGHSFVFKEKTIEIQNRRNNEIEDGLIRIEAKILKKTDFSELLKKLNETPKPCFEPSPFIPPNPFVYDNGPTCSTQQEDIHHVLFKNTLDSGFTAPGKKISEEKDFIQDTNDYKEKFSIIIELKHIDKEEILLKKEKKRCPTCNKKFKSKYLYCPFDGTFLE